MATFDREQLLLALNGLVDELIAGQVAARIKVVGGAAIVLAHDPGRGATLATDVLWTPDRMSRVGATLPG